VWSRKDDAWLEGCVTSLEQTVEHADQHATGPEARAQLMFQRVITGWAMDALALRRRGLDRPGPRQGNSLGAAPPAMRMVYDEPTGPAPAIRWRPRSDMAA
jgi:hypothetical protein